MMKYKNYLYRVKYNAEVKVFHSKILTNQLAEILPQRCKIGKEIR